MHSPGTLPSCRWGLDLSAINIAKGLETDRLFQNILDPEWPFWVAVDRPLPPGHAETEAEVKASKTPVASEGKTADSTALPTGMPLGAPERSSSAASDDQVRPIDAFNILFVSHRSVEPNCHANASLTLLQVAAALGASFAEQVCCDRQLFAPYSINHVALSVLPPFS